MNFFTKNRFITWLLIFLVVINLTALITFFVIFSGRTRSPIPAGSDRACMTMQKELSLNGSQSAEVGEILRHYRTRADTLAATIREYRALLLGELAGDHPDSNKLNSYSGEISSLQDLMQKASIKQYLDLKKICTPDQCRKLSALYFDLYGCKGCGMGKGLQMRHRQGQGQGGCCDSGSVQGK
jgi:Spy/CpxP family protein refolding chaperone